MNLLFAWRYFIARKSTNAIHIIAWVSMVAMLCITAAFIVLLSVFNGFESLVKSLYSSFYADLKVSAAQGKSIRLSKEQLQKISADPRIAAWSLVVEERALLQNGEIQTIVHLKGVDGSHARVTGVDDHMIRGEFTLGDADKAMLVLGSGVENALALQSDRAIYPVTAYLFKRGVNINTIDPYQAFSADNLAPAGAFFIQQDIDNKYALTNLDFMKTMLSMDEDEYGALELALVDPRQEKAVKKSLQQLLGDAYRVETRYEQNRSLYSVMNLEKWAIYGILTLMLVVAAFTMIGALTMLVLEKQKDIQVLKALGADPRRIRKIFLTEGFLLAGLGSAIGLGIAVAICWAQEKFHLIGIEGGSFLIDHYPVEMRTSDFALVILTVLLVAFLASWFPARRAAAQPVQLRS